MAHMSMIEDWKREREERKRRVDLIRADFVSAAVQGLLNLDGLTQDMQRDLENRLGYFGFNVASSDEEELAESVKCLMEMTNDCCLSDEDIVSFQTMDEQERWEWSADRIRECAHWDGSNIAQ